MYRLLIAQPVGYKTQCAELGTWLSQLTFHLGARSKDFDIRYLCVFNPRIGMCRNRCVTHARKVGATHILFVDPDMSPDWYFHQDRNSGARPFWAEAFPFVTKHAQNGQYVVAAAPYCGPPPHEPVHVFVSNKKSGKPVRLRRESAAVLKGWWQVRSVGTGLMLMDARVFDHLPPPYFTDIYTDVYEQDLQITQDIRFCMSCEEAGIPVCVNFDCWARHWQLSPVEKPSIILPGANDPPQESSIPTVSILQEDSHSDPAW